jgi:hypothetical protein
MLRAAARLTNDAMSARVSRHDRNVVAEPAITSAYQRIAVMAHGSDAGRQATVAASASHRPIADVDDIIS